MLFALLFTSIGRCNDFLIIEQFLSSVYNKDYESAREIVLTIESLKLQNQTTTFIEATYFYGQNNISFIEPDPNSKLEQFIFKLAKGYHLLYTDPYSTSPYQLFSESYELAKDLKSKQFQKTSLIAILDVYNFEVMQLNDDQLFYFKRFEELVEDSTDEFHFKLNLLLYNLRNVFYKVELSQEFADDFEKLMQTFSKEHKFWPVYFSTVGVLHEALGENERAKTLHLKAISAIRDQPYLEHLKFRSNIRLSEINRRSNNFDEALRYVEEAEKFLNTSDTLRGQYYLNLYASYNYEGAMNYEEAYEKLKKARELSIALDYKKNSSQISHLNVKYQTAEKEKQILIEQQRATTNRNWLIAAGIALLLGSGIAILFQKNTTKKRKLAEQEALLEQQKVQTLLKEQELVSLDAMIAGQEKERTKVANELHDDLGSLMATVKLHFDNVKVDEKDPAMKSAQDLLEKAYQKIRGMAHAKNSGVMANQGLLPAVQKMAKTINETKALEVTVEDFGLAERMENSLELTIFRIIQELVANIIKHAGATKASIQFTQYEDNMNIIVEDNGKGFDMSAVKRSSSGMGLGSIEKRIEHLEGSFTVDSILGKGTSILIDIPL